MKRRLSASLSILLLFLVLLISLLSVLETHEHCCDNSFCLQCELARSFNDGFLVLLICLISFTFLIPFIASLLTHIIIEYKGRVQSPTKLGIKLIN